MKPRHNEIQYWQCACGQVNEEKYDKVWGPAIGPMCENCGEEYQWEELEEIKNIPI